MRTRVLPALLACACAGLLATGCNRSGQDQPQQQQQQDQAAAQEQAAPATGTTTTAPDQVAEPAPAPAAPARETTSTRSTSSREENRSARERDVRERAEPTVARERRSGETGTGGSQASEGFRPAPVEASQRVVHSVPAGTRLQLEFVDGVSSASSRPGDGFRARVTNPISVGGDVVVPAGSIVHGTVSEVVPLKKIGGQAKLTMDFARLELPDGTAANIHATVREIGKSETGRDAATIGGAAAGGAVLGRVLSKKQENRNTVIGAVVGAAAGTAIAAKTKGQEIELPAGTALEIALDQPAELTVRK